MSVQHFKSLLLKSTLIHREIEREYRRRWPDGMRLLKLKTLHLTIKERLSRLMSGQPDAAYAVIPVRVNSGRRNTLMSPRTSHFISER